MDEKWVTIIYGDGAKTQIPERGVQKAMETAEELKKMAKKRGSGYSEEEAERIYTLRIAKGEE